MKLRIKATNRLVALLFVLAWSLALAVGFLAGSRLEARVEKPYSDFAALLKSRYAKGAVDEKKLMNGCFAGMVDSLGDPHSMFVGPEEAEEFLSGVSGGQLFIGVQVGLHDGRPAIMEVRDDSPAQEAGLKEGDFLLTANGKAVPTDAVKAAELLRGPAEEPLVLRVERPGEGVKEFTLKRRLLSTHPIRLEEVYHLGHRFAHLTVPRFSQKNAEDFPGKVTRLLEMEPEGIVLDLRDNPGGLVDAARLVAGAWTGSWRKVFVFRDSGGRATTGMGIGPARLHDFQTVVLVNGDSASASEIVAGALQDHGLARVIGEQTYGKGSAQVTFPVGGGALLKITSSLWFTPKGRSIEGVGITPDEVVVNDGVGGCGPASCSRKDAQLERALEWLSIGK